MKLMLYIIRGLPGTGKTTLAKELNAVVCEADQFFETLEGYEYDASSIKDAHLWCQDKVENAMHDAYNRIAVSNTFSRRWEMDAYYNLARLYDYQVTEITLTGPIHGNTHNVPEATIQAMKDRWER